MKTKAIIYLISYLVYFKKERGKLIMYSLFFLD